LIYTRALSAPVVPRRFQQCTATQRTHEEERTVDETFPDLGSMSDVELKDVIRQLTEEETDISYKRRILHGKIDILRAELVNRLRKKHDGGEVLITGDDVQKLTDILAGRSARADDAEAASGDGQL
jgi:hypothetical protein